MKEPSVERGSGNVFADLGFPRPEEHQAKVLLAFDVRDRIRECGLTQQEAAERIGLSQADVSKMTRGIVSGFTFDRLFRCLTALDESVRIVVERKPSAEEAGRLVVDTMPAPA